MQVQSIVDRALRRRPRSAVPRGLREPPLLSGALPLIGHTAEFVRSTIGLLRRAQQEAGEVAAIQVAHRRMVAMFGPEAHEAVFRAPDTVLNPQEAYGIMTPVFGEGIVYDATLEKMGEQMKMLLPALKDRRMRTYGESIVGEVEESLRPWGDAGVVDIVDYCRVLTNFTSSRCLLGREFREGMTEEFAHVYHDLERGVTPIAYLHAHLPLPSFRRRDRARVRMVELITGIIADRRREGREGEDFLQTLMEAQYSDGKTLTENEITGLLLAAMFAGHHTSSVTTAWALIELLRNPTYLDRMLDEIDRVFGDGQRVTHAALRDLPLTENAVKETLRLHPPLFMLVRVAQKDFVFKDYFIREGTWVLASPTVSHLIPSVFADPERFDPDRFTPPREEDKRDFAYIAFGGGRHKCLGNAFAILQVKAILAILLGRYDFRLAGDPIASDFHGLVVGPKEPCRLVYHRRTERRVVAAANGASPAARPAAASGCPFHATESPAAGATAPAADANGHAAAAGAAVQPPALRIVLDRDLCQGHAVCVTEAPELFMVGDDGKVALVDGDRPAVELYGRAHAAVKFCPQRVIRLVAVE